MEILNIGNKKIACGLEWEIITDHTRVKKEMKDAAAKLGCIYGLNFKFEETISAGFSTKKFTQPSGGLMLALAHQHFLQNDIDRNNTYRKDWIYIDKDNEKIWMCIVKEGIVAPAGDLIFTSIQEVEDKIVEILNVVDTYLIYTTLPEVQNIIYNKGLNTPVITENFESLTNNIDIKNVSKIKYQKLNGIPPIFLVLGFAFLLLILAYFVYDDFASKQKQKAAALKAKQALALKNKEAEEKYKLEVQNYYKNFIKLRTDAFNKVSVVAYRNSPDITNKIVELANLELNNSGWIPNTLKCSITQIEGETKDNILCVQSLTKSDHTDNEHLIKYYPKAFLTKPLDKTATVEYPLTTESLSSDISQYNFLLADQFAINFVSKMEKLKYPGIEFSILEDPLEISFTPSAVPLTEEQKSQGVVAPRPMERKIGYSKGTFLLKGKGLIELKEAMDYMKWQSLSVETLDFSYIDLMSLQWSLKVSYIVKTTADDLTPPTIGPYNAKDFGLS